MLDAMTPTLSYTTAGNATRAHHRMAGRRRAQHRPRRAMHGGEQRGQGVWHACVTSRERDGDRSHNNLRELDELVARLSRNMQVSSASAPVPEASTSAMLWDADTLSIQHLIEEVLDGPSCALSCLGLRPNLTHPKKTIRARYQVLAIRLRPDKESLVLMPLSKVRAAHDRLMATK